MRFINSKKSDSHVDRGNIRKIQNKKISVIIPIYNVEQYLQRCLESLKNQSYTNFEVLMIDDGSLDTSASIAEKFQLQDRRYRLFKQKNSGQGAARNVGLDHADGDYLAFVDSDDWVHPDFLRILICCAETNKADIVMCGVERVWGSGIHRRNTISNDREYIIENKKEFLYKASFVVWDKLYKRELFDGIRFPAKMKFEDYACTPRVLSRADRIIGLPDVLYYYFWRENSTTNIVKINMDILKAQKILESSEMQKDYQDVLQVYFVRNVMGSLIWAMLHSYKNKCKVAEIMKKGRQQYPDLELKIKKEYIGTGKVLWGKYIYKGYYFRAFVIGSIYNGCRNLIRPVYHQILKIKRG